MPHKINLIDLEPYDKLAKSIVRTIIRDEEARRRIENTDGTKPKKTIPEIRYELLFITSYVSKQIITETMKRITQADQGLLKKLTGDNNDFNRQ